MFLHQYIFNTVSEHTTLLITDFTGMFVNVWTEKLTHTLISDIIVRREQYKYYIYEMLT